MGKTIKMKHKRFNIINFQIKLLYIYIIFQKILKTIKFHCIKFEFGINKVIYLYYIAHTNSYFGLPYTIFDNSYNF